MKHLLQILIAFLLPLSIISCNEKDGRQITDYKEYTLTVASKTLPGVVTSCGNNVYSDVYAVKKEQSAEWEAFGSIAKFEYEEGYEYQIRISETHYLDYAMGEPAWTEYKLLEILSKKRKDSEGLPLNFIPAWYFEHSDMYINPDFAYAIDADKKDEIESDINNNETYKFNGLRYYASFPHLRWFAVDSDMQTREQGIIIRKPKAPEDFPESYKLLPPEAQIQSHGDFIFARETNPDDVVMRFDVFITSQFQAKSFEPQSAVLWLYKDLTDYYREIFPDANVKAVAIRYSFPFKVINE